MTAYTTADQRFGQTHCLRLTPIYHTTRHHFPRDSIFWKTNVSFVEKTIQPVGRNGKKFLCLTETHAIKAHNTAYLADAFLPSALTTLGELHAQSTLSSGKEISAHIGQEAGRTPEPVVTPWRKEKSPSPSGIELRFLGCRTLSLVPIPTELPLLPA